MARSAPDRIGIFGGSFNPVHNGHLHLARFAQSELNLKKVYFVPSGLTPLKRRVPLLPSAVRLSCLRRALRGKKGFALSDCEIRRGGVSYTVDTLAEFRRRFGPGTVLYFLAGADNARNLSRWKSPGKVIKLCRFTILSRPGSQLKFRNARFLPAGRQVLWVSFPALAISSSEVRRRLTAGRSVRGLVPAGTERILEKFKRKAEISSKSKRRSP